MVLTLAHALFVAVCAAFAVSVVLKKLQSHFTGLGPEVAGVLVPPSLCKVMVE